MYARTIVFAALTMGGFGWAASNSIPQLKSTPTAAVRSSTGSGCHPSYTPCIPIARDADCHGGRGDGPIFVGRVRVIGPDVYRLDGDGDGIGCE